MLNFNICTCLWVFDTTVFCQVAFRSKTCCGSGQIQKTVLKLYILYIYGFPPSVLIMSACSVMIHIDRCSEVITSDRLGPLVNICLDCIQPFLHSCIHSVMTALTTVGCDLHLAVHLVHPGQLI